MTTALFLLPLLLHTAHAIPLLDIVNRAEDDSGVSVTTSEGVPDITAEGNATSADEQTSRSSRSNMYGNEIDRLIEAHEWKNLDLHLEWDEHARQLAALTLETVNDGDCLLRQRCFTKVRSETCNEYNQSTLFKCYSVAIEETPYVARQLSTDYLSRTSKILMNNFSRNTKYGCAVSAVRATAKVSCVYVVPKRRITA